MSRALRRLEIRAAALQGESDILRLRLGDQVKDLGRTLDAARQALHLGLMAWRVVAALWERRGEQKTG
ncbi:MAG: hypothetical protein KQH53_19670 [Desulfarculaceae bacterium]|nr:hypothetical protein [Desulfarculaceae bacterium]